MVAAAGFAASADAFESRCPADDVEWVAGNDECLRIRAFNARAFDAEQRPNALVVLVHGDVSRGGPADYLLPIVPRLSPEENGIVVVALYRPGYHDGEGNRSSGTHHQRRDSYTPHNIDAIAAAIGNLHAAYRPRRLVVAGHSGGAAIAGVIIGRFPGLADAAVLAACPCDIARWRATRRSRWSRSLSPSAYADDVEPTTQVVAITGAADQNTYPALTIDYVESLRARGVDAVYQILEGVTHGGAARSEQFLSAIVRVALGEGTPGRRSGSSRPEARSRSSARRTTLAAPGPMEAMPISSGRRRTDPGEVGHGAA